MKLTAVLVCVAACGGDPKTPPVDMAANIDAKPATAVETACGSEIATVMAPAGSLAYMPAATTITQGQVVKFEMPAIHDVNPHPTLPTDSGLRVPFSSTKCFRFTAAGTFNFFCRPHGFAGSITVN